MTTAPPATTTEQSSAPAQAGMVLLALILVAAVANLNLAVANVALPSIGAAFDASQTSLNLIAVGYSLGPGRFGAVLRRPRRPLRPQADAAHRHRARHPLQRARRVVAERAGAVRGPRRGRPLGGMAFPTTLALITALWSGPGRTRSIALWSGIGAAIASLGPLLSGLLLEHFWWGSVFLITLPLAVVALLLAFRLVPAHVNEGTEPVDNLGGVLSVLLVGALVIGINFAAVPSSGEIIAITAGITIVAGVAFVLRQRRAANPLYDLDVAGAPDLLGRGVRGHHRLRLADGLDVHRPAVPAGRARLRHPRRRRGDPPGRDPDGPRRAPVGQDGRASTVPAAPSSRATPSCSSASWPCCCCGRRTSRTGRSGWPTRWSASASASPGPRPRTRSPGPFPSSGWAWRRAPPTSSAISAGRSCSRSSARCWSPATQRPANAAIAASAQASNVTSSVQAELTKSFAGAESVAQQYPQYSDQIIAAAKTSFLKGDQWAYMAGIIAVLLGAALVAFRFPKREEEEALLAAYHQADVAAASGPGSP